MVDKINCHEVPQNLPFAVPIKNLEIRSFSNIGPLTISNTLYKKFVLDNDSERHVRCSEVFLVIYLVASLVLQKHTFKDMESFLKVVQTFFLDCVDDFWEDKQQIISKLRTADIGVDYKHLLNDKLGPLEIQQMLSILEGVRLRILFNLTPQENQPLSKIKVTNEGKIFLSDFGNIEIKLTPLEKTLYLFFLDHPEGVMLHDLVDYRKQLTKFYQTLSGKSIEDIQNHINSLVDVTSNSVNEKISRIKAAFVKALHGKQLAEH